MVAKGKKVQDKKPKKPKSILKSLIPKKQRVTRARKPKAISFTPTAKFDPRNETNYNTMFLNQEKNYVRANGKYNKVLFDRHIKAFNSAYPQGNIMLSESNINDLYDKIIDYSADILKKRAVVYDKTNDVVNDESFNFGLQVADIISKMQKANVNDVLVSQQVYDDLSKRARAINAEFKEREPEWNESLNKTQLKNIAQYMHEMLSEVQRLEKTFFKDSEYVKGIRLFNNSYLRASNLYSYIEQSIEHDEPIDFNKVYNQFLEYYNNCTKVLDFFMKEGIYKDDPDDMSFKYVNTYADVNEKMKELNQIYDNVDTIYKEEEQRSKKQRKSNVKNKLRNIGREIIAKRAKEQAQDEIEHFQKMRQDKKDIMNSLLNTLEADNEDVFDNKQDVLDYVEHNLSDAHLKRVIDEFISDTPLSEMAWPAFRSKMTKILKQDSKEFTELNGNDRTALLSKMWVIYRPNFDDSHILNQRLHKLFEQFKDDEVVIENLQSRNKKNATQKKNELREYIYSYFDKYDIDLQGKYYNQLEDALKQNFMHPETVKISHEKAKLADENSKFIDDEQEAKDEFDRKIQYNNDANEPELTTDGFNRIYNKLVVDDEVKQYIIQNPKEIYVYIFLRMTNIAPKKYISKEALMDMVRKLREHYLIKSSTDPVQKIEIKSIMHDDSGENEDIARFNHEVFMNLVNDLIQDKNVSDFVLSKDPAGLKKYIKRNYPNTSEKNITDAINYVFGLSKDIANNNVNDAVDANDDFVEGPEEDDITSKNTLLDIIYDLRDDPNVKNMFDQQKYNQIKSMIRQKIRENGGLKLTTGNVDAVFLRINNLYKKKKEEEDATTMQAEGIHRRNRKVTKAEIRKLVKLHMKKVKVKPMTKGHSKK